MRERGAEMETKGLRSKREAIMRRVERAQAQLEAELRGKQDQTSDPRPTRRHRKSLLQYIHQVEEENRSRISDSVSLLSTPQRYGTPVHTNTTTWKQDLDSVVDLATSNVLNLVENDREEMLERLKQNEKEIELTNGYETAKLELRQLCEEEQERFLERARQKRLEGGYTQYLLRNAEFISKRKEPVWVSRLADLIFLLDHFGYSAHTKWRSRFVVESKSIADYLRANYAEQISLPRRGKAKQPESNCDKLVFELEQMAQRVNTFTARELIVDIHKFLLLAEGVERDWGESKQSLRKIHQEWEERKQQLASEQRTQVAELKARRQTLLGKSASYETRTRTFGLSIVSPPQNNSRQGYYFAERLVLELEKLEELPVNQHTEEDIGRRYLHILRDCATHGLWHVAFTVYNSMRRRIPRKISRATFRLLLSACKHCVPCCSFQALRVLEEMLRQEVGPNLNDFNAVIDACVPFGEWRLASRILKLMSRCGVGASVATYDTLERLCQNVLYEHSPSVYEAFKLSGVPEAIALGCAKSCQRSQPVQ